MFSNGNPMCDKITLIENCKILPTDEEITEYFMDYFTNIADSLDIDPFYKEVDEQLTIDRIIMRAIDRYKDHSSIRVVNQHVNGNTLSSLM